VKRLGIALVLALLARATHGEPLTLRVRGQIVLDVAGVTAAYVVDPAVADVTMPAPGRVVVTGKSVGSTQLITVTPASTATFLVTVTGTRTTAAQELHEETPVARYGGRYVSESGQMQNAFDVFMRDEERLTEIHLINVHYFRDTFGSTRTSFPLASYHVKTPRREFTILDDFVDVSPLTVASTQVRGLHWLERGLEFHAGYAAPSMYEGLFLPVDRRWVAGAGYAIENGRWRFTPNVYGFFSQSTNQNAKRGAMVSLISEYRSGDVLRARGEVAAGGRSVGASTEIHYDAERDHVHAFGVFKPNDFPGLGLIDLRGLRGVLSWDRIATERLTISTYGSYDRFTLLGSDQRSAFGNLGLRYAVTKRLAFLTGAEVTDLRGFSTSLRSVAIPVGFTYDRPRFGTGVTYRFIENSGTSRRGSSLRMTARAGGPLFQVSAWGEIRKDAPNLDLIFRQVPELEAALIRLGIQVHSPEELARVLRDNAVLVNLGFIEGVTVNLAPRRKLGGFDMSWNAPFASRDRLALHAIYDRTEDVRQLHDAAIATLTYSRRFIGTSDIYGSFTRWRSRTGALVTEQSYYEAGIRADISSLPGLSHRHGPIEGVVFLDPEMRGAVGSDTTPLQGIVVSLDGNRTATTDRAGHYVFAKIPPGTHRIAAQLPPSKPAFFTTPSHADVEGGERVDFGLIWSPARLTGRVLSDAKVPVRGAVVVVTPKNGRAVRTTIDAEGYFRLDLPAGDYRTEIATESLPPGYIVEGDVQRTVHIVADQPVMITLPVRAIRSIAGLATPGAEIELSPLGKKTTADATGAFVFRSLPAGTFKLIARSGQQSTDKVVVLPDEPASMRDVNLMMSGRPSRAPAMVASAPAPAAGGFAVQAGAFRELANAARLVGELRRLGFAPFTIVENGLTLVRIGPYPTRDAASATVDRLHAARFDAIVTRQ
jgi:hypothetical protein